MRKVRPAATAEIVFEKSAGYPTGEGAFHEMGPTEHRTPNNLIARQQVLPGATMTAIPRGPPVVPVTAHIIEAYVPNPPNQAQPTPNFSNTTQIDRWMLYVWYDRLPELRGVLDTYIADVFGEGYGFDGSEAKIKKVERFCRKNRFQTNMKAVLRDKYIGGDGYMGKGMVSKAQVVELIERIWGERLHKSADDFVKAELMQKAIKLRPDLYDPRAIFPIGARYMKINYGPHGNILGYIQTPYASTNVVREVTNTNDEFTVPAANATPQSLFYPIQFDPDEIMHFANDPIGDAIYGTSNIQTSITDIAALWYAKNYGGVFFQNDATPQWMFMMPNESPDSRNYKNFIEKLRTYKMNPHNNMVVTGDITPVKISEANKDLQFGEFMDKYLQRILMGFGMTSRFSHLFTQKLEVPQNLESYYKKINGEQREIEDQLNDELFNYWDVDFYFERSYKRDETREADIVSKIVDLCITPNEGREYLGYKKMDDPELDKLIPGRAKPQPMGNPGSKNEMQTSDARSNQSVEDSTGPGRTKDGRDKKEEDDE